MTDAIVSTTDSNVTTPRVRIYHLLGWMAASALIGAWIHAVNAHVNTRFPPGTIASPDAFYQAVHVVTLGGMLTVAVTSLTWHRRVNVRNLEPGEWLALIAVSDFLFHAAGAIADWNRSRTDGPSWPAWVIWLSYAVLWGAVFGTLAVRRHLNWPWRTVYAILAAYQALSAVSAGVLLYEYIDDPTVIELPGWVWEFLIHSTGPVIACELIAVAVAAIIDLRRGMRHHWMHWTGVVLFLTSGAILTW